jgi:putative membrane protein
VITSYGLATLNALLNATAAICLAGGYLAIKRGERERHRKFMLAAFTASCLFLTSYLTRIVVFGDTKFAGTGAVRVFYFALLISHVLLALAAAPMVITALTLGLRERFETHRKVAKITLPIWAYVSVTGVLVYAFLYHWPK